MSGFKRAFTLVEILIVVIILGVLAAIVVPQFSRAVTESSETATFDQLAKVRRAVSYYWASNPGQYPTVAAGSGTWGELLPAFMRYPPENSYIGSGNARVIVLRDTPDTAFQTDYGWVFSPTTGEVWAGGFDAEDKPLPRP